MIRPQPCVYLAGVVFSTVLVGAADGPAKRAAAPPDAARLETGFRTVVRPFLQTYCVPCHGGDTPKEDLDLETFTSMATALGDPRWALVLERLEAEEMPSPKAKKFPSAGERQKVITWFRALRAHDIKLHAGDPGVVLARRLSNAELNYTVRDLTGVDIRPTREFPVDPANTAGFDNSGESLDDVAGAGEEIPGRGAGRRRAHVPEAGRVFVRTPFDAVGNRPRQVLRAADHRVLSPAEHRLPRTTSKPRGDTNTGPRSAARMPRSRRRRPMRVVSAKYLATVWSVFEGPRETLGPLAKLQAMWRALPGPGPKAADTAGPQRQALRDFIVGLRKKIEPRFLNLATPGVNAAQQPFMIWKNVQYATHRMTFDPAQLQVEGEPAAPPFVGPEPGADERVRPGPHAAHRQPARRSGSAGTGGTASGLRGGVRQVQPRLSGHVLHAGARPELLRHDEGSRPLPRTPAFTA